MKLAKIKVTVNREIFLNQVSSIPFNAAVSLTATNGVLSITCFSAGINCNITAYIVRSGQYFLSGEEWQELVRHVESESMPMVDIEM